MSDEDYAKRDNTYKQYKLMKQKVALLLIPVILVKSLFATAGANGNQQAKNNIASCLCKVSTELAAASPEYSETWVPASIHWHT